ncbi:MAG TPA: DedA family protein [Methanospirillum sp.]|nr:DedA family protein [Methanospirillum sp.]
MQDIILFLSELIFSLLELILHLDKHLPELIATYGDLIYGIIFMTIFCETGLVVTPFLPGDSLLFITGAIAGAGSLNILVLLFLLSIAAVLGDTVNYFIGRYVGVKILDMNLPMIKKEHLDKTHQYYEKYGGNTIIIARFVPFVRTLAPFVAGLGTMEYRTFFMYNVTGGILWIFSFLLAGYFIGTIPIVKENMGIVGIIIILISLAAIGSLIVEVCQFLGTCIIRKNPKQ